MLPTCGEDDLPGLAGAWVIWCGAAGWQATGLLERRTIQLTGTPPGMAPGLAEGLVYAAGRGGGRWLPPGSEPEPGTITMMEAGIAPPAVIRSADGLEGAAQYRAGLARADQIETFLLTGQARQTVKARPLPQQSLGLAAGRVAWTERGPGGDLDLWWWRPGGEAEPLRAGPGDAHRVTGDGWRLAWVERDGVHLLEPERGQEQIFAADTGFLHSPSLWGRAEGSVACWEDRAGADVDVRCSDGVEIRRPGDQLAPWRGAGWLLFHEGRRVMVAWLEGA